MAQRRGFMSRAQDRFWGRDRGRDDPYRDYRDDEYDEAYGPRFARAQRYRDDDDEAARWEREEEHAFGRGYGRPSPGRFATRGHEERRYGEMSFDPERVPNYGPSGFGRNEFGAPPDPGPSYGGLYGDASAQGARVSEPYVGGVQTGASWAQESWGRENPQVPFYGHPHGRYVGGPPAWQNQPAHGASTSPSAASGYGPTHHSNAPPQHGAYGQHGVGQIGQGGPSGQPTYSARYGQSGYQSGYAPSDPRGFAQRGHPAQAPVQQTGYGQGAWAQHSAEGETSDPSQQRHGGYGNPGVGHYDLDYHQWRHAQLSSFDAQYQSWRDTQARQLDSDYGRYRQQPRSDFASRFEDWRKQNQGTLTAPGERPPGNLGPQTSSGESTRGSGWAAGSSAGFGESKSGGLGSNPATLGSSGTTVSGAPDGTSTGSGSPGGTGSGGASAAGTNKGDKDGGSAKH